MHAYRIVHLHKSHRLLHCCKQMSDTTAFKFISSLDDDVQDDTKMAPTGLEYEDGEEGAHEHEEAAEQAEPSGIWKQDGLKCRYDDHGNTVIQLPPTNFSSLIGPPSLREILSFSEDTMMDLDRLIFSEGIHWISTPGKVTLVGWKSSTSFCCEFHN